eukprot:TRINITY_DN10519_c0_g1_i1.p1 TRINITY_DN10519_c0_g1~~TRINITY_DN10519_c0_g1_i1.p1  ORF type:complete len:954 (-),score=164.40 TRINITY_DN10519_c0_g1_i1:126-2987(-)
MKSFFTSSGDGSVREILHDRQREAFDRLTSIAATGSLDEDVSESCKKWRCPTPSSILADAALRSQQMSSLRYKKRLSQQLSMFSVSSLAGLIDEHTSKSYMPREGAEGSQSVKITGSYLGSSSISNGSLQSSSSISKTDTASRLKDGCIPLDIMTHFREVSLLLWHKNTEIQSAAANLFADCAFANGMCRSLIRECGALPTLVALLRSSNVNVQFGSVRAIEACIHDSAANKQIISSSALMSLTALLNSSEPEIQELALSALHGCVKGNDPCKSSFRMSNSIGSLMSLIKSPKSTMNAQIALDIFAELCIGNAENQECLRKMGFFDIVVVYLSSSDSREMQHSAARALGSLCKDNVACKDEFCESGGLYVLMDYLRRTKDIEVPFALEALVNCCEGRAPSREFLHRNGYLTFVLRILHSSNPTNKRAAIYALERCFDWETACKAPEFQSKKALSAIFSCISNDDPVCPSAIAMVATLLSQESVSRVVYRELGLLQRLYDLLQSPSFENPNAVANVLCLLCRGDDEAIDQLRSIGFLVVLMNLLEKVPANGVPPLHVLSCLALASSHEPSSKLLASLEIVQVVTRFLRSYRLDIQALSAQLIGNCICQEEMLSNGNSATVQALVSLLNSRDSIVQYRSAVAVWNLISSKSQSLFAAIYESGGIETMVQLIKGFVDADSAARHREESLARVNHTDGGSVYHYQFILVVLKILQKCLSKEESCRAAFHRSGGPRALIGLLKEESWSNRPIDVVKWSCEVVASSCRNFDTNALQFIQDGVVAHLIRLLQFPHKTVRCSASYALSRVIRFSGSIGVTNANAEDGDLCAVLSELQSSKGDHETLIWLSSTLYYMVFSKDPSLLQAHAKELWNAAEHLCACENQEVQWRASRLCCIILKKGLRLAPSSSNIHSRLNTFQESSNANLRSFSKAALAHAQDYENIDASSDHSFADVTDFVVV